jgi:hypothetical protein
MWRFQVVRDLTDFSKREELLLMLKIFFQLDKLIQCIQIP